MGALRQVDFNGVAAILMLLPIRLLHVKSPPAATR